MLRSNKLLIDNYCPMCRFYAAGFVKTGCIESETIAPYQTVSADILGDTDLERAKTEIALHDTTTGETRYGLDAMIHIVSHTRPLLNQLLRSWIVYQTLKLVYKFITYNRRVIYPCQEKETDRKCIPARHHGFRILLLGLSLFLLSKAAYPIYALIGLFSMHWYLLMTAIAILLFFIGYSRYQKLNQRMDFWGNMATVGLMSTIGIWLIFNLNVIGLLGINIIHLFLGGLMVLIILEGRRRLRILDNKILHANLFMK